MELNSFSNPIPLHLICHIFIYSEYIFSTNTFYQQHLFFPLAYSNEHHIVKILQLQVTFHFNIVYAPNIKANVYYKQIVRNNLNSKNKKSPKKLELELKIMYTLRKIWRRKIVNIFDRIVTSYGFILLNLKTFPSWKFHNAFCYTRLFWNTDWTFRQLY